MTLPRRALLASSLALPVSAQAQPFPNRPVRAVIAHAPGGFVDITSRTALGALAETLGQPAPAENRSGAGGVLASELVARAPADGHTILFNDSSILLNTLLRDDLPYAMRDFRPLSIVASTALAVVVPRDLPVRSLADLAAYGRARPNTLTYISPGSGTPTHLGAQWFGSRTGIGATAVAYRGVGAAFPDLIAGRVDYVFSSIAGARPLIEDGSLRALATTGPARSAALPNVPTAIEAGFPDFIVELWTGAFLPAAVPEAQVAILSDALRRAIRSPAAQAAFIRGGSEPRDMSPAETVAFIAAEEARWRGVLATAPRATAG